MDTNFVVYFHYVDGESEPFYIGEGRISRAYSKANRNRHWHFKVNKHNGYTVKIAHTGLTKAEAEAFEKSLISEYRSKGVALANICSSTMFASHWLVGLPKEMHPMYGKKRVIPEVAESNRRRAGTKMKPRPDLALRNKTQKFNRYTRPVRCIETGEVFPSVKAAADHVKIDDSKINRAIKLGHRSRGYHWEYVNPSRHQDLSSE